VRWKKPRTKRSKTEHCSNLPVYTTQRSELPAKPEPHQKILSELSAKPRTVATYRNIRPRGRNFRTKPEIQWKILSELSTPYRNIQPQGRNFLDSPEKMPAGQLQTFDRWISQTTWSFETKLWGDDEHPKDRLCPKNYSLKLPTTPGIANLGQEHYELEFIRKSTNQKPNPGFEGSRSCTTRHKALTHDPLKKFGEKCDASGF
jgi:hypothetical protein